MSVFRVGSRGADRIVIADSKEEAIEKANKGARLDREAWVRRSGNAPAASVYSFAAELRMSDGCERR